MILRVNTTGARQRWRIAAIGGLAVMAFLVVALPVSYGYYWAGWKRMAQACEGTYSWSWALSHPGFNCTMDNGRRISKLWW